MLTNESINEIIRLYFQKSNVLTSHQISSYNTLIDDILPNILSQFFPLSVIPIDGIFKSVILNIDKIHVRNPIYTENNGCSKIMTPNIARLRNYTYSLSVIIDIGVNYSTYEDNIKIISSTKYIRNILFCKIPIVVKSKYCVYKNDIYSECKYDTGGYAIINGNEKVLITQEKVVPNIIHLYPSANNNTKYKHIGAFLS